MEHAQDRLDDRTRKFIEWFTALRDKITPTPESPEGVLGMGMSSSGQSGAEYGVVFVDSNVSLDFPLPSEIDGVRIHYEPTEPFKSQG